MWIWLVTAAAAGIAAGGTISIWIERKQRRREMETLLELTELVLEEKEVTNRTAGEETIYAKIEDRLIRICRMAKGRQEEAEKSREKLQKLITEIAHQLRTPLANIQSYLELAKGETKGRNEEAYQYIQSAEGAKEKTNAFYVVLLTISLLARVPGLGLVIEFIRTLPTEHFRHPILALAINCEKKVKSCSLFITLFISLLFFGRKNTDYP